jgi:ribosome-associated protein
MAKSNAPTNSKPRMRRGTGATTRTPAKTSSASRKPAVRSVEADVADEPEARDGGPVGVRKKRAARSKTPRLPKAVEGTVRAALDKKAESVVVLDLRKAAGFTDYFVICTGANLRQITAIADGVRETLKRDFDERPALAEGIDRSEWILLDYFNFVVHIFSRDCRAFYGLERLWGNAERIEFSESDSGQ